MAVPARVLVAGLAGCAAAAVLAYCSSGSSAVISRPAAEPGLADLVRSMQSTVRGANSVRVGGHLTQNGTVLRVDLGLRRNGDITGVITQNGAQAQIVAVEGRIYVQATPGFLQQVQASAGSCAAVCGKWIQLTLSEAERVTGELSMTSIIGPLTSGQMSMLTESGSTTVQGQPAWVLRAADGSTLDVSVGSQHYPLEATGGGSSPQVVRYSQWNRVPPPATPAASQVLMPGGASTLAGLAEPTLGAASGT
jgi:hypothetical protein